MGAYFYTLTLIYLVYMYVCCCVYTYLLLGTYSETISVVFWSGFD